MSALGLLLLVGVQGATIINIKYPPESLRSTQLAKRDLSLSYAATNIDSKEGTRVKTITVIKNVNGGGSIGKSSAQQSRLAINPELHKNEEWANAFRDNFESYGVLPEVPDIDDLFDFVNGKKSSSVPEKDAKEHKEEQTPKAVETTTVKATSEQAEDVADSDEATAVVEKIKGDAELLPHIKQANILRLQALGQQPDQGKRLRTRESLINVNYSTPMHSVSQFFENYVQVLPNGYDYSKPQPQPCAQPAPPNSIQVTTPSGRHYDIPQSNSSGTNGGARYPYIAPAVAKRTQISPAAPPQAQPQPQPPNYATVNSIVPPIVQQQQPQPPPSQVNPQVNVPQQQQPQPQLPPLNVGAGSGAVRGGSVSTSQRPYVAPSLRNNGLGINRGPPTPQPPLLPDYRAGNTPSYGANNGFNRPNSFRSRGLKY
ncbi:CG12003 [Drosophila busckii]|uniref:CG12003 n=1 Tax=Drosophila busckii TaxID=30019 RepID=A0A0M3QWG1_DROBS|nr:uncharacterized protein LOC108598124 [Drosophila busckii]ALC44089.1 CG12003 [Drosophila busckii]